MPGGAPVSLTPEQYGIWQTLASINPQLATSYVLQCMQEQASQRVVPPPPAPMSASQRVVPPPPVPMSAPRPAAPLPAPVAGSAPQAPGRSQPPLATTGKAKPTPPTKGIPTKSSRPNAAKKGLATWQKALIGTSIAVITVIATLGIIAVFGSPEARADRFITELTRYDEDSLPLTDWSFQLAKEGSDSVECVVTSVTPGTDFSTVQENFARLESAFSRESDFVLMLMDDEESFNRRMGIYDLQEDQEEVG